MKDNSEEINPLGQDSPLQDIYKQAFDRTEKGSIDIIGPPDNKTNLNPDYKATGGTNPIHKLIKGENGQDLYLTPEEQQEKSNIELSEEKINHVIKIVNGVAYCKICSYTPTYCICIESIFDKAMKSISQSVKDEVDKQAENLDTGRPLLFHHPQPKERTIQLPDAKGKEYINKSQIEDLIKKMEKDWDEIHEFVNRINGFGNIKFHQGRKFQIQETIISLRALINK